MPPSTEDSNLFKGTSGIKYPKHRDVAHKNVDLWLRDRGKDDGAEGLWRVHDKLYDLTEFILSHPGGEDWIKQTKVNILFIYVLLFKVSLKTLGHRHNRSIRNSSFITSTRKCYRSLLY